MVTFTGAMPGHKSRTTDHQPYRTMPLADLLDAFASNEPVPGGGSAAALAGALGVSLLVMVAGLKTTRTGTPEEAADLSEASARLRPLRDTLLSLVDQDSRAYAAVLEARRLPKATEAETLARQAALDAAMRQATDVPLQTMRCCQQAMRGAVIVATNGHRGAATDTGIGVELLVAAVRGGGMNVDVNLGSVSDAALVARVAAERAELADETESDARRIRDLLAGS